MFPNVMTEEICLEISEQKQTNTTDEIPRENLVLTDIMAVIYRKNDRIIQLQLKAYSSTIFCLYQTRF